MGITVGIEKKTESEKQHLSDIMRGHPPTFTGHHTEEAKRRISEKTLWRNLNASEEIYKKVSETAKGNKMMNKGGKCIRVHPEDFEKYLNDGWVFGGNSRKGKYANRHQKKPANYTTLGTKWMNNGTVNKCVPKDKVEVFLKDGWVFGMAKTNGLISNK